MDCTAIVQISFVEMHRMRGYAEELVDEMRLGNATASALPSLEALIARVDARNAQRTYREFMPRFRFCPEQVDNASAY